MNDPLRTIIVNEDRLRETTAKALEALYKANKPPQIFRRSGVLVRINRDERGIPFTEALSEAAFRGLLERACDFVKTTSGGHVPTPPPLDVVRDCMSLGEWKFPPLLGITETPVLRPDGSVVTSPGYDSITNLYYLPSPKLAVPNIHDRPTTMEIRQAVGLVAETICDFPFDSEPSRANAIATMLTPVLRPMIDGPVPLAIFDKPQQGTGASLLAETISIICSGRPAAMMSAKGSEEEWEKSLTSLLMKGRLLVNIDNVVGVLDSAILGTMLTSSHYEARILGRSESIILPIRCTWIATGNNLQLRGDLPRRCIWIRLDAQEARPWLRDPSIFKHPRQIEWVSENRGRILGAILTIARGYVAAGMPEAEQKPNLGGYESYCRVLRGFLSFMGIGGFLGNLHAMYAQTDGETPQWEAFLETWHEIIGDHAVTAAELIDCVKDNQALHAALPDAIADTDLPNYVVRLGQKLSRQKGVRYPSGLMLVSAGEKKRAVTWDVVRFQNATSP